MTRHKILRYANCSLHDSVCIYFAADKNNKLFKTIYHNNCSSSVYTNGLQGNIKYVCVHFAHFAISDIGLYNLRWQMTSHNAIALLLKC